jgi:fucose permease
MIIGDIIGNLLTAIVLAIWGSTVSTVLWVFTCFMGFFIGMVYPNGMAWSNLHLDMNSMSVMLLSFAGSFGGFVYTSLTGSLFENVGPETLMYIMVVYAAGLGLVYIIMQTVAYCHMRNLVSNTGTVCEEDAEKVESDIRL